MLFKCNAFPSKYLSYYDIKYPNFNTNFTTFHHNNITYIYFSFTAAVTLGFNGSESVMVSMATGRRTQTDDLSLRIRTRIQDALVLVTTSDTNKDTLELTLSAGRIKLTATMGTESQVGGVFSLFHIPVPLA